MGNYFKRKPLQAPNQKLIAAMRSKKLVSLQEVIDVLQTYYGQSLRLVLHDFIDAFEGLLQSDCEAFFTQMEKTQSLDGEVDVLECLCILVIFSIGEFEEKLQYIYKLFDFDQSGSIERKELEMILQTCIKAMCKLINLRLPTYLDIQSFAQTLFLIMDKDHNSKISLDEFRDSMLFDTQLQDYLLQHATIQTFQNAKRRHEETYQKFNLAWLSSVDQDKNKTETQGDKLHQLLIDLVPKQFLKEFMDLLIDTSKNETIQIEDNIITQMTYKNVVAAYAAYFATDINSDNKVDISELRYLIYAFEGDEPSHFRVEDSMAQMDILQRNFITMNDWFNYLCSSNSQGKHIFRAKLKKMFQTHDMNEKGGLNKVELRKLLEQCLKDHHYKNSKDRDNIKMISELCQVILIGMDDQSGEPVLKKHQILQIKWNKFKLLMEDAYIKMDQLDEFLKA